MPFVSPLSLTLGTAALVERLSWQHRSIGEDAMKAEELKEFYLAKAKEAEDLAAHTSDLDHKERWLSIAEGYRILASTRFAAHAR